jgi:hypothetical protein
MALSAVEQGRRSAVRQENESFIEFHVQGDSISTVHDNCSPALIDQMGANVRINSDNSLTRFICSIRGFVI